MTDKELLKKTAERLRKIAEDTQRITTGNMSHNLTCLRGFAIRAAESIERHLQDEPVSKDLEGAVKKYLTSLRESHFEGYDIERAFKKGAQWQKENLWKSAQGDDLPEIDREVIALIEAFGHYKVIFAHRVDENAEIHTSIDGKPLVLHPKKHGKGGWNISNIKWWLDIELPKMEE